MAKQDRTEQEQSVSGIEQVESQHKHLADQIQRLLSEIEQVSVALAAPGHQKEAAKASYNASLDRGDEDGMKRALSAIRSSNAAYEKLAASIGEFDEPIARLRESQSTLTRKANACRMEAEKKFELSRTQFRKTEAVVDICKTLLPALGILDAKLADLRDQTSLKESSAKREPPQIEGNT